MFRFPIIKSKYHVEIVDGQGIFLLSENEKHLLEGETMFQLVPLLNGRNGWLDIISLLDPVVGRDAAIAGLDILLRCNHLEEAVDPQLRPFQIFWSELGLDAVRAAALIASNPLHVFGLDADTTAAVNCLRSCGFSVNETSRCSLPLVIVDDYQNGGLDAINRQNTSLGRPWILLKPQGLVPMVGPFFRPGKGPCWKCLENRLRQNRDAETFINQYTGRSAHFPINKAVVPLGETQAISLTILQMIRWLARGENAHFESRISTINVLTGEQRTHQVIRRPQCQVCGTPMIARVAGRPVALMERSVSTANENGVRAEDPDMTFNRYAHHISEISGVVKGIAPSPTNSTGPVKSYIAGHNFALKADDLLFIKSTLRSNSSGKGKSEAQARTSALCEALERYSGLYRGEEEQVFSSFNQLSDEAIDPRTVMQFSETQYLERDSRLAKSSFYRMVPVPFDENAVISWSPIWSWTQGRRKYLPTGLMYYGFPQPMELSFAWADSNGAAAGSYFEDAALQGALELVERDAVAIWWANRLPRKSIDLDSLNDPFIDELRAFYKARNRTFWILDVTSDFKVPVAVAISRRETGPTEDIIMGFGAHFDPRIAVSRALTEMNQFMPAVLDICENGFTRYGIADDDAIAWWKTATIENQPYLTSTLASVRIDDLPPVPASSVTRLLLELFERIEAKGLEILILDQTRPDIGLPVVKVVVPGMRHFWARYAPGRLFDVPVAEGWLEKAKTEPELNPTVMFL
ncbi:TOMM precursor leader peptide-binding protein [Mesorhizobium sp. CA18]|uniref:TOMM precursor leader peptide-binding protein n=1 Tax=unclassified Mesorhizobium TaxID=325217 RepID=UPI001CCDA8E2|nr:MULTISPECIES: TOMM precursor leader peptide-binding protein [unclassified Mesorhizobium]MBZ9737274.1 TOMM precursor leader peptide-binding protein [Mesorhizobium sp. CA9]MBZ9826554.1 TOMM precursor leader peptide-binding protein [Mesorhizobium sp. CA18]MBZ9830781.1 TOMM precursor leader peptide-binding protein [Mesorhizobium sp. CA2]MBZ9835543.1 TOMM precursor leader peptide-binding protein [Mesorhizobium sp. CA3]MBZ9875773.1 TOMM precursor leader peptide-binding protein [Mesorhizobium sp. 